LLWLALLAVIAAGVVALEGNQETGFEHRGVWAIDGRGQTVPTESFGCQLAGNGQSQCSSKRIGRPVTPPPFLPGRREAHLGVSVDQLRGECAKLVREGRGRFQVQFGPTAISCGLPKH